ADSRSAVEQLTALTQELDQRQQQHQEATMENEKLRVVHQQLELDKAERDVALANREESLAQLRKLFEKPENWLFIEPNSSLAEALAEQPEPLLAESL